MTQRSGRTRRVFVGLATAAGVLIGTAVGLAAPTVQTHNLGAGGEIPSWLVLGYLPIPAASNTWSQTLDADLLAAAGGEAGLQPAGGQTVRLGNANWTWQVAQVVPRVMARLNARCDWLPLFDGPAGKPMTNTAAYLACTLVSPGATQVRLLLGSNDSVKVLLNGTVLHRFVGRRSLVDDADDILLPLKAGPNRLLVRVDKRGFHGGLACRLMDSQGAPPPSLTVELAAAANAPALPQPPAAAKPWLELTAEIPRLSPAADEGQFGARLGRTMALLETSAITRRPVRIIFYGQSITSQPWTQLLVERLRERYPKAIIQAENVALGGWTMPSLMRTLGHNVLRSRPDLVVFHVYCGTMDQWDRVISAIRRETCADILMRSAHPQVYSSAAHAEGLDANALEMRAIAAKFDCEFVECRREWTNYLDKHGIAVSNFLRDAIHLNDHGCVLMAELYERHFRINPAARGGWMNQVRWYGARRSTEDRVEDQIVLRGDWRDGGRWVQSGATGDALRLRFIGNRVDVVLAPGKGSARVLIDGQPPSALNLFHGAFPIFGPRMPWLTRYFTGPNMRAEKWTLKITEWTGDRKQFRFRLSGSVTGPDGGGEHGKDFVSRSGRIRIDAADFGLPKAPPPEQQGPHPADMRPAPDDMTLTWRIVSDSRDIVQATPAAPESDRQNPPCSWVTVADGLQFGRHELTLIPVGDGPIGIVGIEAYRPPLAKEGVRSQAAVARP